MEQISVVAAATSVPQPHLQNFTELTDANHQVVPTSNAQNSSYYTIVTGLARDQLSLCSLSPFELLKSHP
jgi:hypothetical protein